VPDGIADRPQQIAVYFGRKPGLSHEVRVLPGRS
jgi:hypothetical protein